MVFNSYCGRVCIAVEYSLDLEIELSKWNDLRVNYSQDYYWAPSANNTLNAHWIIAWTIHAHSISSRSIYILSPELCHQCACRWPSGWHSAYKLQFLCTSNINFFDQIMSKWPTKFGEIGGNLNTYHMTKYLECSPQIDFQNFVIDYIRDSITSANTI